MKFYVYIMFRPWDGSPCYVGKGQGARWQHPMRRSSSYNRHVRAIVAKARKLGLDVPIVVVRRSLSERDAFDTECAFIAAIGRNNLANMTNGGEGCSGAKRAASTKRKQSLAALGNQRSKGRRHTEEALAKMRAFHSNRPPEMQAKMTAFHRGRTLPEWHRKKLSEAHKGKKLSPEHIANIGRAQKGLTRSPETRKRMSDAQNHRFARERASKTHIITPWDAAGITQGAWYSRCSRARKTKAKEEKQRPHQLSLDLE